MNERAEQDGVHTDAATNQTTQNRVNYDTAHASKQRVDSLHITANDTFEKIATIRQ